MADFVTCAYMRDFQMTDFSRKFEGLHKLSNEIIILFQTPFTCRDFILGNAAFRMFGKPGYCH